MSTTVQIRQRGTLTIPTDLRKKYNLQQGDTYRLIDLDGIFVLAPMAPMVPELAREIENIRREQGWTTDELLHALREERERYYHDEYE